MLFFNFFSLFGSFFIIQSAGSGYELIVVTRNEIKRKRGKKYIEGKSTQEWFEVCLFPLKS